MRKLFLLFILIVFMGSGIAAQSDSCSLRISLLTCAPGSDLYATFGHTAVRVQDGDAGQDLVYNYGTFVFDDNFYIKFIRGSLLYSLSVETFGEFMDEYQQESRSVQEQVLLLGCNDKRRLQHALEVNALEANRYYKYNFLYDNCTTRARDIIAKSAPAPVVFDKILPPKPPSFRSMIHSYLDAGHEYWSELGIDLLMGTPVDRKVTNLQSMFLPDYLLKGLDAAHVDGRRLAGPPETILKMPSPLDRHELLTPTFVFMTLLLVAGSLSFFRKRGAAAFFNVFDPLFFLILGLAGWVMLFMWFGTAHEVCRNNFNLLLALPTHVVVPFALYRRPAWLRGYLKITFVLSVLLLLLWWFLPQQMNSALVPVLLLLIIRTGMLQKPRSNEGKTNAL